MGASGTAVKFHWNPGWIAQNPRLTYNSPAKLSHPNLKECSREASIIMALQNEVRERAMGRRRTATTREKGAQRNSWPAQKASGKRFQITALILTRDLVEEVPPIEGWP
jgi:hypothetical protein